MCQFPLIVAVCDHNPPTLDAPTDERQFKNLTITRASNIVKVEWKYQSQVSFGDFLSNLAYFFGKSEVVTKNRRCVFCTSFRWPNNNVGYTDYSSVYPMQYKYSLAYAYIGLYSAYWQEEKGENEQNPRIKFAPLQTYDSIIGILRGPCVWVLWKGLKRWIDTFTDTWYIKSSKSTSWNL